MIINVNYSIVKQINISIYGGNIMNVHLTLKYCIITILLILWLSSPTLAAELWTKADMAREAAFVAVTVIDWSQTLKTADHPEKWTENNPILGEHPSRGKVNTYFPAGILLHAVIAYALPRPYREWWQYTWIGVETAAVGKNLSVGIGISF